MAELKQYIEEVNENRNNKGLILQDLIALVRFDEYVETIALVDFDVYTETYSCRYRDYVKNDNETICEFYDFLNSLITQYGLDYELDDSEPNYIDRIYGNGVNSEKVAYYYFEEFLQQRLLSL